MAPKKVTPAPNRLKTPFFLLLLALMGFWNFRMHRENRRLAQMVREARRSAQNTPAPVIPRIIVNDPELAGRINDERDTIEALTQQLQEAGVPNVSALKAAVQRQEEKVTDLREAMRRLLLSRPAQLDPKAQRQQLGEQIASETQLIAQLKAKVQRYRTSRKKEQRAEVPTLLAQVEAENQVLHDLKEQRTNLLNNPRQPAMAAAESPEQKAEREGLQNRLQSEADQLAQLKNQLETARNTPIDSDARRLQQELEKHQGILRQLEAKARK